MSGSKVFDALKYNTRGFDKYDIEPAIGGVIDNAAGTVEVSIESLKATEILSNDRDTPALPSLGDVLVTAKGIVVKEEAKPPVSRLPFLSTALFPIEIV